MVWVVRKISKAKWKKPAGEGSKSDTIAADAVTADLRTEKNQLSFWLCIDPRDSAELNKVVLALATLYERPNIMDVAWLDGNVLKSVGISLDPTDGKTKVVTLQSLHVDAGPFDLSTLATLAHLFAESIRDHDRCKRISEKKVLQILCEALEEGLFSLDDLEEKQKKLRAAIEKRQASNQ